MNYGIYCPDCEYEIEEWFEYFEGGDFDGNEVEIECPDCGETYICRINIETTFDTFKE